MNIVNIGYDSTNYYVLGSVGRRLLIDIGFPNTLGKLRHTLRIKQIALEQIGFLFATHYHPDHAGLAGELQQLGITLVVAEPQKPFVPLLKTFLKPDLPFAPIDLKAVQIVSLEASRAWLASISISGELVATPGHSDDSVSLVLDNGMAFTGDLGPQQLASGDDDPLSQSWARLRKQGARTIYPGHGSQRSFE